MKAQVVVYNRACCVKYKKAIDALLGTDDQTTIVMHTGGDKADDYKEYRRTRDEEKKLLDQFRDPLSPLKFVIVTSKLLTGFDAPILQCMYLDKPMKNHTLLQAICRTNRTYNENKKCGLVVDFVGVFDDVAKSLAFDEETVKTIIKNIDEIKALIPDYMQECIEFFPGVDRTVGGWEGLSAAQQCLKDEGVKTNFAKKFARLAKAWEIVSPDAYLQTWQEDYSWLAQAYLSVRPVATGGSLIWTLLGAKTIEIIHRNGEEYQGVGKYPICGSAGVMGYGNKKLCEHDTIILGRKGNIDKPIYMNEDYWIVDTAFCLLPKRDIIHPVYLYYWCKQFDFQKLNKQAVLPSLTRSDLEQIEIQVPKMEDQMMFVEVVQQADKSKFELKQAIEKIDKVMRALMQ